MTDKCPICGGATFIADNVSIYGVYDSFHFHKFKVTNVQELIDEWINHNSQPQPAIVNGDKINDLGPAELCPAIVCAGDKELRRVGEMVFWRGGNFDREKLEEYKNALLNDPDVPRLLERAGGNNGDTD